MWIMGCVDENDQLIKVEPSSFKDLNKLSPLIICNSTAKSTSVASATSALFEETNSTSARKTTTVISSARPVSIFNHHQVRIAGALQSTRWSPTAEQLMALEELYRNGTKTPTAQQIQEITAKLRRFGKIEGKNVFYWFQNHKARDKKKQRLKMELAASRSNLKATRHLHNHHYSKTLDRHNNQSPEILGTEGARGTSLEVENTKREPHSNCRAVSEESASAPRAATTTVTERRTNTTQVKKEIKPYYNYSSWKPMEMPFCYPIINLISTAKQPTVIPMASLDHKLMLEREPLMHTYNNSSGMSFFSNHEIKQSSTIQTLELFPLQSDNLKNDCNNDQLAHEDTKNVPFGAGNCGLIKSDLSLSLLVSLEN